MDRFDWGSNLVGEFRRTTMEENVQRHFDAIQEKLDLLRGHL